MCICQESHVVFGLVVFLKADIRVCRTEISRYLHEELIQSTFGQRNITPGYSVLALICGKGQQCRTISCVLECCIKKAQFPEECRDLSCKLREQCFNTSLLEECMPASASHTFQKLKSLIAVNTHICSSVWRCYVTSLPKCETGRITCTAS